jgi:hypothetical protein
VFVLTAGHVVFLKLLFLPLVCSRLGTADNGSRTRLLAATRVGGDVVVPVTSLPSFGPFWLAFAVYSYWRRLPAERKAAIKERTRALAVKIQRLRARPRDNGSGSEASLLDESQN